MRIEDGEAEQHPTPLAVNASATPGVAPPTVREPGADSPANAGSQVGGVRDCTGERLSALAASEAEFAAAQSFGMSADGGRRQHYLTTTSPLGASAGDAMALPEVVSDQSKHTGGSDATAYDPAG